MKKSILLIMVGIMLAITYFSIHAVPDIKIINVSGYNYGINYTDYWYLKFGYLALLLILIFKKN